VCADGLFFCYARHAIDGELGTDHDGLLVVDSMCGTSRRA
jgi:hypothetical protein